MILRGFRVFCAPYHIAAPVPRVETDHLQWVAGEKGTAEILGAGSDVEGTPRRADHAVGDDRRTVDLAACRVFDDGHSHLAALVRCQAQCLQFIRILPNQYWPIRLYDGECVRSTSVTWDRFQ